MNQMSDEDIPLDSLNISAEEVNQLAQYVFNQLVEDRIKGQCLEYHRAARLGFLFLDESKEGCAEKFELVRRDGFDIFGQSYNVKCAPKFVSACPVCHSNVSSVLYASHLAKCMNCGGRSSSRVAKERIANVGKAENKGDIESDTEDYDNYDNDGDWEDSSDRKPKRKTKNASKKTINRRKGRNNRGGGGGGGAIDSTGWDYERMSMEQKREIFDQVCGVVSEDDKKVCTRLRCQKHTNDQRNYIREYYLSRPCIDDVQINVDAVD